MDAVKIQKALQRMGLVRPDPPPPTRLGRAWARTKQHGAWVNKQVDRALLSPILLTGGLAGMGASKAGGSTARGAARFVGNTVRKHPVLSALGGAALLDLPGARAVGEFAAYPVTMPLGELKALANQELTPAMQRSMNTVPNITPEGPFSGADRYAFGVRRRTMVPGPAPDAEQVVKESAMQLPSITSILQKTAAPAPPAGAWEQVTRGVAGIPAGLLAGSVALAGGLAKKEIESAIRKRRQPGLLREVFGGGGAFRKALGYGLGAGVLGGGALAATKTYEHVSDPYKKEHAFNKMVKMSPALKSEDQGAVRNSFNVLWKFNRDVAEEPAAAAPFVRRAVMFKDEGIQTTDIKTLAEIKKNLSESRKSQGGTLPTSAAELAYFATNDK